MSYRVINVEWAHTLCRHEPCPSSEHMIMPVEPGVYAHSAWRRANMERPGPTVGLGAGPLNHRGWRSRRVARVGTNSCAAATGEGPLSLHRRAPAA